MTDVSHANGNPKHGHWTDFEIDIAVLETWKGPGLADVIGTMRAVYSDPDVDFVDGSPCGALIPQRYQGFVVIPSNDANPTFNKCEHNAWIIEELETGQLRDLVRSKLQDE